MKRLVLLFVAVAALLAGQGDVASSALTRPAVSPRIPQVDRDYLLALNTADEFLHAWLRRDWMEGPKYLTVGFKERVGEQAVKSFFSGVSNPHHQGYEIVGVGPVAPNVMRFHIWLYEYYTDSDPPPVRRPDPLILDLERVDKRAWLVKEFPHQQ